MHFLSITYFALDAIKMRVGGGVGERLLRVCVCICISSIINYRWNITYLFYDRRACNMLVRICKMLSRVYIVKIS